jgi:hypothetical protein
MGGLSAYLALMEIGSTSREVIHRHASCTRVAIGTPCAGERMATQFRAARKYVPEFLIAKKALHRGA